MSRSDYLCFSHLLCICQRLRIPFQKSTQRRSATSYLGDTNLGLETQGYQRKCLQHKFVNKSRERLRKTSMETTQTQHVTEDVE